jgi:DNA-binding GntR family transcriptional regulator
MSTLDALNHVGSLSRGALRHGVVLRLVEAIFHGDLPAGTRLVAQRLAERFGISPTPIREALVELEAVGVVRFVHNRGAMVKQFGPEQLHQIYHLRRILEAEATRCACGRIDLEALQTLKQQMTELLQASDGGDWSEQAMAADRRLHDLIAESCANPRLADEIRRYGTLMQTTREIVGNARHVQGQALLEHLPIIEALLAQEAELAASQMARHIDSTAESVETIMFRRQ